jgi:two-component system, chemotaxis family, chemotaxis protein CheY
MFPANTKILIVDDSTLARNMLVTALSELGFSNYRYSQDGKMAIQTLNREQQTGQPVGLIFSDIQMPTLTGLDLLKIVRSDDNFKDVPFIILSVETGRAAILDAIATGSSQYILKPVTTPVLKEKLRTAWERIKKKPASIGK